MADTKRVEAAKRALLDTVVQRSDGKPYTPPGLTRELILALLEQAGTRGMTSGDIQNEFPHRSSKSPRILNSMEASREIVKRGNTYLLPNFAVGGHRSVGMAGVSPPSPTPPAPPVPAPPPPPTQQAADLAEPTPEKVATTTYRILRDTELARRVKSLHRFECQVCGHTIEVPDGSRYAEAHHIQPLGQPHNGPDVIGNILCLCPNHHAEFDLGVSAIDLSAIRCCDGHEVNQKYVDYHNQHVVKSGRR